MFGITRFSYSRRKLEIKYFACTSSHTLRATRKTRKKSYAMWICKHLSRFTMSDVKPTAMVFLLQIIVVVIDNNLYDKSETFCYNNILSDRPAGLESLFTRTRGPRGPRDLEMFVVRPNKPVHSCAGINAKRANAHAKRQKHCEINRRTMKNTRRQADQTVARECAFDIRTLTNYASGFSTLSPVHVRAHTYAVSLMFGLLRSPYSRERHLIPFYSI